MKNNVTFFRSEDVLTMNVYQGYQGGPFAPGSQSQLVMFSLETLADKYEEGIELLQDTLFHVEFTQDRVKTVLATFLNGLPAMKLR